MESVLRMEEKPQFIPLELPTSHLLEGVTQRYRVVKTNGEVLEVEATSAHEAIAKSGVEKPLKVVSGISEKNRMLQKNVLIPEDRSVPTDIDISNNVSDMRFLIFNELEEEKSDEPFEEMTLVALAKPKAETNPPEKKEINGTNGYHAPVQAEEAVTLQEPSASTQQDAVPENIKESPESETPLVLSPELQALQNKELSEDDIAKLLGD